MSEIVVYTTLAVVFSRHDDDATAEDVEGESPSLTGGGVLWRPVADGAWTQLHLFLEMERDVAPSSTTCAATGATVTSPRQQLMRNFRLVAWVLETGKVIVNDVVCAKCMWAPIDELLWQFTSADGHCYGFRFHSVEQADECAQVVCGILNNVDEIRRLVKKMFQTRTTTREFLALLYDIGFFKLDSSRRSTMIEPYLLQSAHAAVASLQAQAEFPRSRRGMHSLYPKEAVSETTTGATTAATPSPSARGTRSSERAAPAAADDATSAEAGIIQRSTEKRSSNHHLLAQFSEVQLATLAATELNRKFAATETVAEDPESSSPSSDGDSEDGDSEGSDNDEDGGDDHGTKIAETAAPTREEFVSRSTTIDTSEMSASASRDGARASVQAKDCISMPYKTRQELHVTYNQELARYEGLPWAWRRLNHQFGLPVEAVPKRHVAGYAKKIPAVLQMLKEAMIANGGFLVEGIFRLAPDKDKCAAVKQSINDGTFTGCTDVHIIANLIKVWFRELPQSLFNTIPEKHIYRTCDLKSPEAVMASLDVFPPLYENLVKWLLDLMAEATRHEKHNKMTARNMAIVISPNLFSIESDNPMYALTMSQKVAEFTFVLLDARLRHDSR